MDWKNPDYGAIFRERLQMLEYLRANPNEWDALKAYYAAGNYADFISDWGVTFDPRNPERGLPSILPFVLFGKQREFVDFVVRKWKAQRPGLVEKSRDVGASWLSTALACTLCLFHQGLAIGFGSRKEEYVDKIGTYKPLLPKARMFMENLPEELAGGWVPWRDAPYMRINFPSTGSLIMGEAGDEIGRGDRASIYFVDESAHLERPELVEHSLSQTTNCRIDMSSVKGMNNPFAKKRHEGKVEVFIFDWRDDPRKDEAWYKKQEEDLDPITVAQEIDRDYLASVSGIVIPGKWVRAALDAHLKLGIKPTGKRRCSLDIADEGVDLNAIAGQTGIVVDELREWSGKDSDVFATTARAFEFLDEKQVYDSIRYDADGIGASVRGDARVINQQRAEKNVRTYNFVGWRGSEAVVNPEGVVQGTVGSDGDKGRTNQDYFGNRKAQGWWWLREKFRKTHRWIVDGYPCDPDEIISIDSKMPLAMKLVNELSQPTYGQNGVGKLIINKKPTTKGIKIRSPNLGDCLMMLNAPGDDDQVLNITPQAMSELRSAVMQAGRSRAAVPRAKRYYR